jgi:high-affinity Fe2+/Pb2+ permease
MARLRSNHSQKWRSFSWWHMAVVVAVDLLTLREGLEAVVLAVPVVDVRLCI